MPFEWDEQKRRSNLDKHGVDFIQAAQVLLDVHIRKEDTRLDYGEKRYVAYGPSEGRLLCVVYADRGECIRIISARKANSRERRHYEEVIQKTREQKL